MNVFRLLTTLLKINIQQELAYRADAAVNILINLMWLGWEMLSLRIIFSNTATLGGWGPGELIALLGVFRLVNVLLAASGILIIYSLWIILIACTFWFVKFDNNVTILQALLDTGRYPATVYPFWLRLIVTFIVPIAVATTVPLQALRGDLLWWQVLLFLTIGAASLV